MKETIIGEIIKDYRISRRNAEELLNISLFYECNLDEAKNIIKKFFLSEA